MNYNKYEIMKEAWNIRRSEKLNMSISLKRSWAKAKAPKGENKMNEIKALIEKYQLVKMGDKVGTYNTKGVDKAAFVREVAPRKAEILAYFEAEAKEKEMVRRKKEETFNAIPGVLQIKKARSQRAEWIREFNRAMESEADAMRPVDAPNPQQLKELEDQFPMAVFALESEYRNYNTENFELHDIWSKTYNAICNGQDIAQVKAEHEKRIAEFTEKHLWD